MNPTDPLPPAVEQFVRQATSPDRATHARALTGLAKAGADRAPAIFAALAAGPDGPRVALEYLSRLSGRLPRDVIRAAVPLLSEKSVPIGVKLGAGGVLLGAVPDEARSVSLVVQAATGGLPRSRVLERMLQLQSRVEKCESLDALVAASEGKVRLRCPRCPSRLTRRELITHLWHKHRLVFEHGKARDPQTILDEVVTAAVEATDASEIDQTFLVTGMYYPEAPPRQVLQALAARGGDPAPTERLLDLARDDRAGLCPVCLAAVPDPVPALPPPAEVSDGRVSAAGYEARVEDTPTTRVRFVGTPTETGVREIESGRRRPPRLVAVMLALPVFVLAVVAVVLMPIDYASPVWVAVWLSVVAWLVYVAARMTRPPLPDRTRRAIELAWTDLVPGVGRSPEAIRFLVRLCRASLGVGDPVARSAQVFELAQQAAVLAPKGGAFAQLHAAVRVLEVFDNAKLGRERLPGLVEVFVPFLRGEATPAYAEAAAELLRAPQVLSAGDQQRLGVLVIEAAFVQGLSASDLVTAGRFCPWFRRLVLDARPDHLGLLHTIWRARGSRPWKEIGDAATVFEFARESASEARQLLADAPDVVLRLELGDAVESVLGLVTLTTRGLSIAGRVVAEPDADIALVRATDEWKLRFGRHRFTLRDRLPEGTAEGFREWVRLWAMVLIPTAAQSATREPGQRVLAVLGPNAVVCPLCATRSLIRKGRIGTPWQAIGGSG